MKTAELFSFLNSLIRGIEDTRAYPEYPSLEPAYLSGLVLMVLNGDISDEEKLRYLNLMRIPMREPITKLKDSNPKAAEYLDRFYTSSQAMGHFTYAKIPAELWADLLTDFLRIQRDSAMKQEAPDFFGPEMKELTKRNYDREQELLKQGYTELDQDWMAK